MESLYSLTWEHWLHYAADLLLFLNTDVTSSTAVLNSFLKRQECDQIQVMVRLRTS